MTTPSLLPTIGPYQVAHRIAVGGMAEVYRAMLPQSAGAPRAVVIKRMLPHLATHERCVRMFEEEARLGRQIRHPNVVEVLSSGVERGSPYLALEYVFGVDLWRLQRDLAYRKERLRPSVALYLATEMLAGLVAVHQATDPKGRPMDVIHRDVSPSNLFLSVHGEVKLGDLGIARATLRDTGRRSPILGGKGKLGYVAPEVLRGSAATQQADLFAAAVITAELLIGSPLFSGATELSILLAIREGNIAHFERYAPSLPAGLANAIRHALQAEPKERTATAELLYQELLPFLSEPPRKLAAELGMLVMHALESGRFVEGPVDRSSLAQTVEADNPLRIKELARGTLRDRVTPPPPSIEYFIIQGGERHGPLTHGEIVMELRSGEASSDTAVSINGGAPIAIGSVPGLTAHLPRPSSPPLMTTWGEPSASYDLSTTSVAFPLVRAHAARWTGLILCESAGQRREIYVADGNLIAVSSNRPEDMLGQTLVRDGLLAHEQLDQALAMMPRHDGRLGETLIALDLVDPIDLFQQMSALSQERLLSVFEWSQGRALIYDGVEASDRSFPLLENLWDLVAAGVERLADSQRTDGETLERLSLPEGFVLPFDLDAIWGVLDQPMRVDRLNEAKIPWTWGQIRTLLAIGAVRWLA